MPSQEHWSGRHWTSRDGLKLFYRDYPGKDEHPPILCLHGLTRNSRDFEQFAEHYARRFRIIVPDFRGRGRSDHDPNAANYLPSTYAADVLQLLDQLNIEKAIFVGTSLGGLVTMLVAAMQPQRIAAVVLNDVGPDLDQRGIERIRTYLGKPMRFQDWSEAASHIAAINRGLPASNNQDDWVRAARRVCREGADGAIVFDYDMAIAEPFNQRNDVAAPVDMWPLYRQFAGVPILIVRGEISDLLSAATAQAMVDFHPDAELVTVPGVGHAPELNEPVAVAAIDRLLDRATGKNASA